MDEEGNDHGLISITIYVPISKVWVKPQYEDSRCSVEIRTGHLMNTNRNFIA
jgi:hypothetical protein